MVEVNVFQVRSRRQGLEQGRWRGGSTVREHAHAGPDQAHGVRGADGAIDRQGRCSKGRGNFDLGQSSLKAGREPLCAPNYQSVRDLRGEGPACRRDGPIFVQWFVPEGSRIALTSPRAATIWMGAAQRSPRGTLLTTRHKDAGTGDGCRTLQVKVTASRPSLP
jgi:hypothetical protein